MMMVLWGKFYVPTLRPRSVLHHHPHPHSTNYNPPPPRIVFVYPVSHSLSLFLIFSLSLSFCLSMFCMRAFKYAFDCSRFPENSSSFVGCISLVHVCFVRGFACSCVVCVCSSSPFSRFCALSAPRASCFNDYML